MAPAVDCSAVCTLMAISACLHIYQSRDLQRRATLEEAHHHPVHPHPLLSINIADKLVGSDCREGSGQVPMTGLQRSATTFRRSGSSGLVWDERFLTEADPDAKAGDGAAEEPAPQPELRHSRSIGSIGMLRRGGATRAGSDGGDDRKVKEKEKERKKGHKEEARGSNQQLFRTKDVAPDVDPPSPWVFGCILCAIFGGSGARAGTARRRAKPRKKGRRRSNT